MENKRFLFNFFASNLVMFVIAIVAWQLGLVSGLGNLPRSEYIMMGFLTFQWSLGLWFVIQKKWESVFYTANALPIWGLICLGLNIFNIIAGANAISPEVAFGIVKGAGLAILINSFGVFLMVWLKQLAYFCGGRHV